MTQNLQSKPEANTPQGLQPPEGISGAKSVPLATAVPEPTGATPQNHPTQTADAAPASQQGVRRSTENAPKRRVPMPWIIGGAAVVAVCGVAMLWGMGGLHGSHAGSDGKSPAQGRLTVDSAIPVSTILPERKTLERTLVQPGTIEPWAQAELYAKVPGYLEYIRRESPEGPEIDIGSKVRAGDELMRIEVPELRQDVAEGETFVKQRDAELEEARSTIAMLEASVEAAKATQLLAEADVERAQSDFAFQTSQFTRVDRLVRDRSISADNLDEARHQLATASAALKSSQAKVKSAQAELSVISSKLITAAADVKVKEALVQAAKDKLERAKIVARYASLSAPFDGIVTYRGVDEGDFVQNASSGQTRRLMTVTALDKVKVVLKVREADAVWVEVGAEASVEVDARLSWKGKGQVSRIGHVLEGQSRTMQVEIDLDNRDHKLKPGMYGIVTLSLQRFPNALALPATAVYSRQGSSYVLQVEDGVVERHRVRLRYDDGREVEVVKLEGDKEIPLTGSEELVVSNKGEIAEKQHVQATRLRGA